jgi:hypothetical protein
MAGKKTSAKTIYVFVLASIALILGVAYLFMPPPRAAKHNAATSGER